MLYIFLISDPYFIANNSFLWRIAFMSIAMIVVRLKFYFAWTVGKICDLRQVKNVDSNLLFFSFNF